MTDAKDKSNRPAGTINGTRTDFIRDSGVEQRQRNMMVGTERLIGRVVSFVHHNLEWWMIMLMSLTAFTALMLLCHRCSCNVKRQTRQALQSPDDLDVEPGGAL